jgi:DnaJ-class molecular chaperone
MRLKFSQRNQVGRATGAAKKTLYDFLGVDPGADAQTVKRAFRKTVKEHHRDDPAASQRTKVLLAAHELLSDP